MAHAPLEQGRGVVTDLAALREAGRTVGIRRLLQDEPLSFFEHPGLVDGLRALAKWGLPFDACIRHHQLAALTALLAKVPDLPVVLDHLAKPPVATGDDGTWERNLRALAALPQVSVKLSGMPPELRDGQDLVSAVRPWLEVTLDAFGADRAMVGAIGPFRRWRPDGWHLAGGCRLCLTSWPPAPRSANNCPGARRLASMASDSSPVAFETREAKIERRELRHRRVQS